MYLIDATSVTALPQSVRVLTGHLVLWPSGLKSFLLCLPHLEKEEQCPMSEAWDVDQGLITKLKEQYRKERKGKKGVKSKSSRAVPLPVSSDGVYPGFFPIFPFLLLPTRHCSVQPLCSSIRHLFPHYLSSLFHCHLLWKSHENPRLLLFLFIPLFMFLPSFFLATPLPN